MATSKSGVFAMSRNSGAGTACMRMMQNGNSKVTIVYVEGETDVGFYKHLIDTNVATITLMDGKKEAIKSVANANKLGKKGVIAIVDSDFDNLLQFEPVENVIRTDTHDIETLMLREKIFDVARDGFIDPDKLKKMGYQETDIKDKILKIGRRIGKLRLISEEKNLNLNFRSAEYDLKRNLIYVKAGKIVFNEKQYIYECVKNAKKCSLSCEEVFDIFMNDEREFDTWQICRGHDLVLLISVFYSKDIIGYFNVYESAISNLLKTAYVVSNCFEKTLMYAEIVSWQKNNGGRIILKG